MQPRGRRYAIALAFYLTVPVLELGGPTDVVLAVVVAAVLVGLARRGRSRAEVAA